MRPACQATQVGHFLIYRRELSHLGHVELFLPYGRTLESEYMGSASRSTSQPLASSRMSDPCSYHVVIPPRRHRPMRSRGRGPWAPHAAIDVFNYRQLRPIRSISFAPRCCSSRTETPGTAASCTMRACVHVRRQWSSVSDARIALIPQNERKTLEATEMAFVSTKRCSTDHQVCG